MSNVFLSFSSTQKSLHLRCTRENKQTKPEKNSCRDFNRIYELLIWRETPLTGRLLSCFSCLPVIREPHDTEIWIWERVTLWWMCTDNDGYPQAAKSSQFCRSPQIQMFQLFFELFFVSNLSIAALMHKVCCVAMIASNSELSCQLHIKQF